MDLPLELVIIIFAIIDSTHKSSLSCLALVSKRFNSLAATFQFRTMTVYLKDNTSPANNSVLLESSVLDHTHHLIVRERRRDGRVHAAGVGDGWKQEENEIWKPLVRLISTALPHLDEFTYDCYNPFPSSLWTALENRGKYKLRIDTFQLPSMRYPWPEPSALEIAISTSPNLHSLTCAFDWPEHMYHAVRSLVAGLAPQLQELHPFYCSLVAAIHPPRPYRAEPLPFQDSVLSILPELRSRLDPPRGKLRRLVLGRQYSAKEIIPWLEVTDSSFLTHLCISLGEVETQTLTYLATTPIFSSLESLILRLQDYLPTIIKPQSYYEARCQFLCSIPPLRQVSTLYISRLLHFQASETCFTL
jgi:hypothetical protein